MVEQEEKGTRFLICNVVKSVALKFFSPNHFFPYLCHTSGETTSAAFYFICCFFFKFHFFLHSHRSIKEARHYTGPDFSSRQSQWCKQNTSVSTCHQSSHEAWRTFQTDSRPLGPTPDFHTILLTASHRQSFVHSAFWNHCYFHYLINCILTTVLYRKTHLTFWEIHPYKALIL